MSDSCGTPERCDTLESRGISDRSDTSESCGTPERCVTSVSRGIPERCVTSVSRGIPERCVTPESCGTPVRCVTSVSCALGSGGTGVSAPDEATCAEADLPRRLLLLRTTAPGVGLGFRLRSTSQEDELLLFAVALTEMTFLADGRSSPYFISQIATLSTGERRKEIVAYGRHCRGLGDGSPCSSYSYM